MNTYKQCLILLFATTVIQKGWSEVATSFDYPADNYSASGLGWGGLNGAYIIDGLPGKHVGEDYITPAETRVKAAGNGKVMYARVHGVCPNWGYLTIIEHTLSDGSKICTLYGHCEPIISESEMTQKGQIIGHVSHFSCWSDHLHFGVFNGPYGNQVGVYPFWAVGYMSQNDWPGSYIKPSNFIAQHQASSVLPGQLADGTFNLHVKACANQFSSFGLVPYSNGGGGLYVHDWQGIIIQDFRGSDGKDYAIIDNGRLGQAFLLKGGIRWYYLTQLNGPVDLQEPTSNEYAYAYYPYVNGSFNLSAAKITWIRQDFESSDAVMWRNQYSSQGQLQDVYALLPPVGGGDPSVVTIALTSSFTAYALSDTQAYVSAGPIYGGVVYQVYRDGSHVGSLSGSYDFVDSGLTPSTSYSYELAVSDSAGNVLARFGPTTVTTKAASPPPSVPLVDFEYWLSTGSIEVSVPTYSGATIAQVVVGSRRYQANPGSFYTVTGLDNGTYDVHIELLDNNSQLVATSLNKTVVLGAPVLVSVSGPSIVRPNASGVARFTVTNPQSSPLYDWQYCIVKSSDPWLVPDRDIFFNPGSVPANGSVTIDVPFTTQDYYNPVREVSLHIFAMAKCDTSGLTGVTISGHYKVAVEPFTDLAVGLTISQRVINLGESALIIIDVTNEGNQSTPSVRLWVLDGDNIVADILVPQLASRETWRLVLPLGSFDTIGTHDITAIIDPFNEVPEVLDDSYSVTELAIVDNTEYALNPTADTRLYYNDHSTSVVDSHEETIRVSVRPEIVYQNSLLDFPLPAIIVADNEELTAQLSVYVDSISEYCQGSLVSVNRLTQSWDPDAVDWYHRASSSNWSMPGGTYTSSGEASVIIPTQGGGTSAYHQWFTFNVTQAVLDQLNGAFGYGFLLRLDPASGGCGNNAIFIASNDHPDPSLHPRLDINVFRREMVTRDVLTNNIAVATIEVMAPPSPTPLPTPVLPPDLLVQSIQFTPVTDQLLSDQVYAVTMVLKNDGPGSVGSFMVSASVWGKIYARTVSGLSSGEVFPWTFSTGPFTPTCGMRYGITVNVDPTNLIGESREDNNSMVGGLLSGVCPDTLTPTLTSISTPTSIPTWTPLPTLTNTLSPTITSTVTSTPTARSTQVVPRTATRTKTVSPTPSPTVRPTLSRSPTSTLVMRSPTVVPTPTRTPSRSPTVAPSVMPTPTRTPIRVMIATRTATPTSLRRPTITPTRTPFRLPTMAPTPTRFALPRSLLTPIKINQLKVIR